MSREPLATVRLVDVMDLVTHALALERGDDARGALALLLSAAAMVLGEVANSPAQARDLALSIGPAMAELVEAHLGDRLRYATPHGSA